MNRIVVDNKSSMMTDIQCLECVISVMFLGHLEDAEDEYAEEVVLNHFDKEITVVYKRGDGSDLFSVTDKDLSYRLN